MTLLRNVTYIDTVLVLSIIVLSLLFAYIESMLKKKDMAVVTDVVCCTRF